jgi:adenine-specific DNA-methyltransferase
MPPLIKYIGSKRLLIPAILEQVSRVPGAATVLDLFSGTSRVGHALKAAGYRVIANDHNAYAHALGVSYVQADREELFERAEMLVAEFNALAARFPSPSDHSGGDAQDAGDGDDPFTRTYCRRSRYFHPANGRRIFAVREAIARRCLDPELESVLLVALMEAADRVDSTTGVQMAYLKRWAPRAVKDLRLRMPALLPRAAHGKGLALRLDAIDAASQSRADIAYIDPPYNQHSYLGNYHVWESLVRWDFPEVYGAACKRIDCRDRRSDFNSRVKIKPALRALLAAASAKVLIVSFSDEGHISPQEMEAMLAERAGGPDRITAIGHDYKRYVGAQIGIYNPRGEKVGSVGRLRNREYLYIARLQ